MRSVLQIGPGAVAEYYEWLESGRHGDSLVYYVGDLQFDRSQTSANDDDTARTNLIVLNALADRVVSDAKQNLVALTQRRLAYARYEYVATILRPERERLRQANEQSDAEPVPAR